jgi:hypothetical protein
MDCRQRRIQLAITGRVAPSSCITSTTSHPPLWHSRRHLAANGEDGADGRMVERAYCRPRFLSRLPLCLVVTPSHCVGSGATGFPHLAACWRTTGWTGEPTAFRPRTMPPFRVLRGLRLAGWASTHSDPWRMLRPNLGFPCWDFGCRTLVSANHRPSSATARLGLRVRTISCLRLKPPFVIRGQKIKAPRSPTSFPAHHALPATTPSGHLSSSSTENHPHHSFLPRVTDHTH